MSYTTLEKWQAYAEAGGDAGPNSAESVTLAEQALVRACRYIRRTYELNLLPQFATTPLVSPVLEAFEEATNIAAGHELANPGRYNVIISPAEEREIIKLGDISYRPSTHATTTDRVVDSVPQDADIHKLLDRYIVRPTGNNNNPTGTDGFVLAAVVGCK